MALTLSHVYPSFVLLIVTTILSSPSSTSTAQSNGCTDGDKYSANSTYSKNLNLILSYMPSNASKSSGGFYNTSTGIVPDKVYALALCRGDLALRACFDCINSSIEGIRKQCPDQTEAIYWGPGISSSTCMLRYSNRDILSAMEVTPSFSVPNPNDISPNQLDQFNETFYKLMATLLTNASSGLTSKFAAGGLNFTSSDKIYGLTQCTPDISETDCRVCLQGALVELSECCGRKQGGRILRPSCIAWFELNQFYDSITVETPSVFPLDPTTAADLPPPSTTSKRESNRTTSRTTVIIVVSIVILLALVVVSVICGVLYKRKAKLNQDDGSAVKSSETLQFNLSTIKAATNDFHDSKKLGQGGFGSVYKGELQNGQEIAVKRLAKHSSQGELEFQNEILLVAKLQHRNLVRLLGFCVEGTERMLVYEFVRNGSLDQFIFDSIKRGQLNWDIYYKIICGIARGILYLHEDSHLRIIHRDLKASNILLDEEMNPKISDFGMARLFALNQIQDNTARTVGTYGYMAPEYALHGQFSVKSDVFSFGILLLEIVSGKRNSWTNYSGELEHLPSYAWKNWREGTAENLIDPSVSNFKSIVMRCIHIGLLCVQEHAAKRPAMASVVLMLNSNSMSLPPPMQPAFLMSDSVEAGLPSSPGSSQFSQWGQSTEARYLLLSQVTT